MPRGWSASSSCRPESSVGRHLSARALAFPLRHFISFFERQDRTETPAESCQRAAGRRAAKAGWAPEDGRGQPAPRLVRKVFPHKQEKARRQTAPPKTAARSLSSLANAVLSQANTVLSHAPNVRSMRTLQREADSGARVARESRAGFVLPKGSDDDDAAHRTVLH